MNQTSDQSAVQIEVPKGHHIVRRVMYGTPTHFHSAVGIWPEDRKWWQFWLPKMLTVYFTVEPKPRAATNRQRSGDKSRSH